ncbi:hypothetical protein [Lactiplantibacillus pentosus]|uniref:hypothetical protein n=1 Tax=Lactiplantibacillus pentosus TaxID=1589 RepID=UPI003D79C3CA
MCLTLPSLELLLNRIRKAELQNLAELLLTQRMFETFSSKSKMVDYRAAIMKRAGNNKLVRAKLKRYLYSHVTTTATDTRNLLGVNVRFFNKIQNLGLICAAYAEKNPFGSGEVKYFTYADIVKCYENAVLKTEKTHYDATHAKNQQRAKKAAETKFAQTRAIIDNLDIRVRKVKSAKLFKNALDSKLKFETEKYYERMPERMDWELPTLQDLQNAPVADQNRWVDNYIRHQLTNYDDIDIEGLVGVHQMYAADLRAKMTAKIRQVYPFYRMDTYVQNYLGR